MEGDHHHDPVTGFDYIYTDGKWKATRAIPLHDTLSSVDVEEINDIVAKGLSAVGVSAPVLNAADNTEFKLAP